MYGILGSCGVCCVCVLGRKDGLRWVGVERDDVDADIRGHCLGTQLTLAKSDSGGTR